MAARSMAARSMAAHSMAPHTAWRRTAWRLTQHGGAQHSMAAHKMAAHSMAPHKAWRLTAWRLTKHGGAQHGASTALMASPQHGASTAWSLHSMAPPQHDGWDGASTARRLCTPTMRKVLQKCYKWCRSSGKHAFHSAPCKKSCIMTWSGPQSARAVDCKEGRASSSLCTSTHNAHRQKEGSTRVFDRARKGWCRGRQGEAGETRERGECMGKEATPPCAMRAGRVAGW